MSPAVPGSSTVVRHAAAGHHGGVMATSGNLLQRGVLEYGVCAASIPAGGGGIGQPDRTFGEEELVSGGSSGSRKGMGDGLRLNGCFVDMDVISFSSWPRHSPATLSTL